MTTLHDIGGLLGRPSDTFFWALTISWSRMILVVSEEEHFVELDSDHIGCA